MLYYRAIVDFVDSDTTMIQNKKTITTGRKDEDVVVVVVATILRRAMLYSVL